MEAVQNLNGKQLIKILTSRLTLNSLSSLLRGFKLKDVLFIIDDTEGLRDEGKRITYLKKSKDKNKTVELF